MTAQEWTLEELIGKVADQLDDTAYAGAPNGRVRDVPDARAVRWYTTIGLVDRPVMRGRTAWYGPRHLAQLVAIKRRQSQGFKIAEIQAELAEVPDEVLQRIAELTDTTTNAKSTVAPRRFWVQRPAEYVAQEPDPEKGNGSERARRKPADAVRRSQGRPESGGVRPALDQMRPGGFGRVRPEIERARPEAGSSGPEFEHIGPDPAPIEPALSEAGTVRPESAHAIASPSPVDRTLSESAIGDHTPAGEHAPAGGRASAGAHVPAGDRSSAGAHVPAGWVVPDRRSAPVGTGLLSGVPLGGGAVLLLNATPTEDDLEAIRGAARELMDLLATRGLVTADETTMRRGNAT
ncbi:MerR family transcriptional regulator [Dactylosporangium sp. CA-052675]|uniref:helix-turn-helix domain-containing protein n=1 Tax=Dactylosporangium sp. CA-052675 TaxID=3239927 RepID=UPI003D9477FD